MNHTVAQVPFPVMWRWFRAILKLSCQLITSVVISQGHAQGLHTMPGQGTEPNIAITYLEREREREREREINQPVLQ